jgi:hypothetical protein
MASLLELQLQARYPQYRRIWVHYSHKARYHVCITLFPLNGHAYQMAFGETSVVNLETVSKILDEYLVNQK